MILENPIIALLQNLCFDHYVVQEPPFLSIVL